MKSQITQEFLYNPVISGLNCL